MGLTTSNNTSHDHHVTDHVTTGNGFPTEQRMGPHDIRR